MRADLLLLGEYLNVYTGEVLEGPVAIKGDRILCVGERVQAKDEVRVEGLILPGFKDGHVHIESSKLAPQEFARAVVPHGTTSVFADPHEIVNVAGVEGFKYMLNSSKEVPLRVHLMVPSCVPASPFEESPHHITPDDVERLLEGSYGLGEVMNFPGVIRGDEDLLKGITASKKRRLPVDGHAPHLKGLDLCLYLFRGVESDHESTSSQEALEKLRKGMYVMIREGSASKDMGIVKGIPHTRRILLVTDDRSALSLLKDGHVDHLLRRAVEEGMDPVKAVQAVTINVAERFRLYELDGIAPGRLADLTVVKDLRSFQVSRVYVGGKLVAKDGNPLFKAPKPKRIGVMRVPPLKPEDFLIRAEGEVVRVRVIGLTGSLITKELVEELPVIEGFVRGEHHLAVVERHGRTGHVGRGFVRGFSFTGAIASTVAHDSHNLVVAGSNEKDMLLAVKELSRVGGGQTVVKDGEVLATLPLPVGGIMSDLSAEEVAAKEEELIKAYKLAGGAREDPFMELSFLALSVIPELKVTPKGLVKVTESGINLVSPIL